MNRFFAALLLFGRLNVAISGLEFGDIRPLSMFNHKYELKMLRKCNPFSDDKIKFNTYLKRVSNNLTEVQGNLTNSIPIDDTLFFDINIATKDLSGFWKDNVYIHKSPNACSSYKRIVGNGWKMFVNAIGRTDTNCPLLPGVYKFHNLDASFIEKTEMPKSMVQGTYKIRIRLLRNSEIVGCQIVTVEIKRPR